MPAVRPVIEEEWGRCQSCSGSYPVSQLRLNRRFGWQCLPGNWRGTSGCWAGNFFRDEVPPPYRPGEGTRRSAAPTVDTTEGIETNDGRRLHLEDWTNGLTYRLTFTSGIAQAAITPPPIGRRSVRLNGDWHLYMTGGVQTVSPVVLEGSTALPMNLAGRLYVSGGTLTYTPE